MPEKDFSGNNKPDFIHCICINARSLCNKLFELHGLLYSGSFDIIFVVESWLTADKANILFIDMIVTAGPEVVSVLLLLVSICLLI